MSETATCELCGEPMPPGEEMFKFHGYSGPCPGPIAIKSMQPDQRQTPTPPLVERLRATAHELACDLANMGDEAHEPPEITWGELDEIGREADEAADEIERLTAAPTKTCAWTENENGAWDTACGRTWEFTHDGPVENRMTYCMGCGGFVHALDEVRRG